MKKTITYTCAHEHPGERYARAGLLFMVGVCAIAYMLLVSLSVVHVVARKEAAAEASATASRIAALESELFALNATVVADAAATYGLTAVENKHFVTRTVVLGRAD